MADRDEDYFVPLEDQRVFGAGITRKRIEFVPASTTDGAIANFSPATTRSTSRPNVADRYLSIVLPSAEEKSGAAPASKDGYGHVAAEEPPAVGDTTICTICKQPLLSPTHESTIAHQLCLEHSHPPSHLDRSRHGLRYLSSFGWDPDARVGLGARADGIRYPIKPVPKYDTVGLREKTGVEDVTNRVKNKKRTQPHRNEKKVMMNAKEARKMDAEAKKKAERLRKVFYGSEEVDRYLGGG